MEGEKKKTVVKLLKMTTYIKIYKMILSIYVIYAHKHNKKNLNGHTPKQQIDRYFYSPELLWNNMKHSMLQSSSHTDSEYVRSHMQVTQRYQ